MYLYLLKAKSDMIGERKTEESQVFLQSTVYQSFNLKKERKLNLKLSFFI